MNALLACAPTRLLAGHPTLSAVSLAHSPVVRTGMLSSLPPARTIVHRCPPTPITVVGLLGRWSPGTTTWGDRRLDRGSGHVVVGAHGCVESWRG